MGLNLTYGGERYSRATPFAENRQAVLCSGGASLRDVRWGRGVLARPSAQTPSPTKPPPEIPNVLSLIKCGVLGLSSLPNRQAACLENASLDESALGNSSGEIGTRLQPQTQMANRSLSAIEVRNLVLCGGGGEQLCPPPTSPPPPRNAANSTARERRSSPNVALTPPFAHSPTPRFSLSRPLCQCIQDKLGYTGREHAREARWGSICAQGESGAREPPPSRRTDKLSSAQEVSPFAINAGAGEHLCPPTPGPLPPG